MRDLDVREQLHRLLDVKFKDDPSTVVVDELGICQGQVRVDVAAVNGHLYGFEIKAAADTLKRLNGQVEAYGRVLDFASIVVAPKHLDAARKQIPRWWGIYVAKFDGTQLMIRKCRTPRRNPDIEPRALAELLWHSDTLQLLEARGAIAGVRSKPRSYAWDRLCEVYTLDEIRDAVRLKIKERRGSRSGPLHA